MYSKVKYHPTASTPDVLLILAHQWIEKTLRKWENTSYSVRRSSLPFPVLFVLPCASVFAMLTPLSCCLCLIFVSSSVLLLFLFFFFVIHVSLVLCCMCPHPVFVFVFKYPWRGWKYINLADVLAVAQMLIDDVHTQSYTHTQANWRYDSLDVYCISAGDSQRTEGLC